MAFRRWDSLGSILLSVVTLTGCLATSAGALTEYGRVDENTTLPETTSLQGKIRGVNMLTHKNRTIYGFMGIPYAEPPLGELRFKAPVAASAWNGTYNASSDPNTCPQPIGGTIIGDEDCLYLQLYTPKLPGNNNSTLLPVMVFILGGGFYTGSVTVESFGPTFLLDKDVILVVPAFRLGVLGYLSTGDEASPGNYALKDIVLALEWIRDNIQYFGGDPDQVTLAGSSSGAMTVSLLAMADATQGLFHRCITESGTPLSFDLVSPVEARVNETIQLAEYFGCPTDSSTLLVQCLRNINALQLVGTNKEFHVWDSLPDVVWYPTVEPDIEGALLTDTFTNLFAAGKVHDIPWLNLLVRDEGIVRTMRFYESADVFDEFLENMDSLLPYLVGWDPNNEYLPAYTAALKSYYVNDFTADRSLLLKNVTNMASDAMFIWPGYRWARQHLLQAENPLYFTSFEYRGVFSHSYDYSGGNTNRTEFVPHGDEIIYLFEDIKRRFGPAHYEYSETDLVMVDTMVQLWTSFVTNGTPAITDSNLSTTIWEPYSSLNNYLRIGDGSDTALEMKYDLHIERMRFWEELTSSLYAASPTSGQTRKRVELLPISLCFIFLFALQQRWHGH